MTSTLSAIRVRELNDAFRIGGFSTGQWMLTRGVVALGPDFITLVTQAVQGFDGFTPDNDPYGEHDFGSFNLCGETLFWKIDCYDTTLTYGSDDPSDPTVTRRVLTIMLASEY
ncbi:MAG: DUF3768 domain-containing protein [Rhizobiales bacterium]|nr:DUF3768 domain-containing protein [Hyphomicrobiales bacterium]